eukprot:COSAG01_NODE_6712_length_3532_cov_19.370146_3_plen_102_part_00
MTCRSGAGQPLSARALATLDTVLRQRSMASMVCDMLVARCRACRSCLPQPLRPQLTWFLVSLVFVGDGALRDGFPVAAQQGSGALAAVASFCAAVLTEIYL